MVCFSQRSKISFSEVIKKGNDAFLLLSALLILVAILGLPTAASGRFSSMSKYIPITGFGPNPTKNYLQKIAGFHDLSDFKPILRVGEEYGLLPHHS